MPSESLRVPLALNSLLGNIPLSEIERQRDRHELRETLTAQYRKISHYIISSLLLTTATVRLSGLPTGVVPWSYLWKAAVDHRVVIVGSPLSRPLTSPLTDPGRMTLDEVRWVLAAVRQGDCRFERVSEEEFLTLSAKHQADVEAGRIIPPPPRRARSDKGEVRGAHLNPETRTKTRRRGKQIRSKPTIESESEIEDSDEKWERDRARRSELSSDPIEEWTD